MHLLTICVGSVEPAASSETMEAKMSETAGVTRFVCAAVGSLVCLLAMPASTAWAQAAASQLQGDPEDVAIGQKHYSPYLNRTYPDRVLWGDTHLHTSYSTDAGMIGNFLGPEEAFRFARGETVRASVGERARLVRPLDFLVVADHAENLGLAALIEEFNPMLLRNAWGKKVHDLVKAGKPQEKVYDVAWAGDRTPGDDGKLPPVGNTVQGARLTNDIGQAVLGAWWQDPDFDPALRAFYYVRVLEIPTPTWLAYDKAFYGDKVELPEDAKLVHQERAYTSPIWYTPKG
jgi:hypothetical protein